MNSTSLVLADFKDQKKNICLIFPFFPLKVNDWNRIGSVTTPPVHRLLDKHTKFHFDSCGKYKIKTTKIFYNCFRERGRLLLSEVVKSPGHEAEHFCSNLLPATDLLVVSQQVIPTKNFREICHKLDTQTKSSSQKVKPCAQYHRISSFPWWQKWIEIIKRGSSWNKQPVLSQKLHLTCLVLPLKV